MKHKSARPSAVHRSTNISAIIAWIAGCEIVGMIGGFATMSEIPTWYATLSKPSFSPPNWVFGPVWTLLYALMGYAAYRIWQLGLKKKEVRLSILVFLLQLVLNLMWSFIFFSQHNIGAAFGEIVVLWLLIAGLVWKFEKLDTVAGYVMIPYLLWVTFAMLLNYNLFLLN